MRYQTKYKDLDKWEPCTEKYMRMIVGSNVKDLDLAIKLMHDGEQIETMFAWYRMAPPDDEADVLALIVYYEEQGEPETAKQLREYLAQGKIKNVDRHGKEK